MVVVSALDVRWDSDRGFNMIIMAENINVSAGEMLINVEEDTLELLLINDSHPDYHNASIPSFLFKKTNQFLA